MHTPLVRALRRPRIDSADRQPAEVTHARLSWAALILSASAVALLAGPRGPLGVFWRPVSLDPEPAGLQIAGLAVSTVVEAVGFGLAIAVLTLGRPLFSRITTSFARSTTAQLTCAWLLGSWWPHTALHMHYGLQAGALTILELTFHAGSVIAFVAFVYAVLLQPKTPSVTQ